MHYCNLKDAWGENTISQNYYTENAKKVMENFQPLKPKTNIENSKEKIKILDLDICNCQELISRVLKCPECRRKLTKLLVPSILTTLNDAIEIYREPIVLILMTVFIILLINIISKI